MSLIIRVNPFPGWGRGWTRKVTPLIPIFHNDVNVLGGSGGGVKVARDFAHVFYKVKK
jgi:hypothetical protein